MRMNIAIMREFVNLVSFVEKCFVNNNGSRGPLSGPTLHVRESRISAWESYGKVT